MGIATTLGPARVPTPAIAYIGASLPSLTETFVYRELLGLRARGHQVVPVTIHSPAEHPPGTTLALLAEEALHVYTWRTAFAMIVALFLYPRAALTALSDAAMADLDSQLARQKFLFQAWMGLATAFRLRKRGIGHVHAHLANTPATVGLYLARGLGARFSFTGHAADLFVNRGALAFKLAEADFTVAISHWHRRFYNSIMPAPLARRPVIRCSVALPPLGTDEGRDIVSVGRLVPKKGFDLLVRAFASLQDKAIRLRIAGDGPERERLEALALAEGIADRVTFLGARPHADCLALIRACAIFALPCRVSSTGDRDGIPVVLMEAMAAAKPVVAGRLEAIAELVEHDANGLLVPPDDVESLTVALDRLVADADLRRRMGKAGRAHVAEEFADDPNWDRLEAALDRAGAAG